MSNLDVVVVEDGGKFLASCAQYPRYYGVGPNPFAALVNLATLMFERLNRGSL